MLRIIKAYLWPTEYIGIKPISEEGLRINKKKIQAYKKGQDYVGPRGGLTDDAVLRTNRELAKPHMKTFMCRWAVIALVSLALSNGFSFVGITVLEALFFGIFCVATLAVIFLRWLHSEMKDD